MHKRIRLSDVPIDEAFVFNGDSSNTVYEHRGNGWHQIYGKSYTGGPWHADVDTIVIVEEHEEHHQRLSCFI